MPDLGTRLSELDHPVIRKAQSVPEEDVAGQAETIRSLSDRRWIKVKTSEWRAAVSDLQAELPDNVLTYGAHWWIGDAGVRQDDSPHKDFYARLTREAHASGPHSCSTDFLLPSTWDIDRLLAEAAVFATLTIQAHVREAARQSLLNSDTRAFAIGDADVRVRIRLQSDGIVYVAIGTTGMLEIAFFTALFSSLPGVTVSEWLPEPGGSIDIEPADGEILWSTILTPEAQQLLMQSD